MIILHITAPAPVGGLERVVHGLALGQHRAGHDVHLAVVTERDAPRLPLVDRLIASGIAVHPVVQGPRAYSRERTRVMQLCRSLRPDVAHTHGYRTDVIDATAAQRCGVPVISTVHGFTGGGLKNWVYERLQLSALRRIDAVAAVSRPLFSDLRRLGVSPDRLHLVPNAFPDTDPMLDRRAARAELGLPQDGLIAGWAARFTHQKAPDVMLRAMQHLGDTPLTVAMLGDGPLRMPLALYAHQRGIARRIHWCGAVADAGRLFRAFDLFVLSSRSEGTPIAIFEAMAAEVPIVSTRAGGVPDVLSPAEAMLVPMDDPEALAKAIRWVIDARAAAAARARAALRRLLRDYQPDPWVRRYEAIYRSVATAAAVPVAV